MSSGQIHLPSPNGKNDSSAIQSTREKPFAFGTGGGSGTRLVQIEKYSPMRDGALDRYAQNGSEKHFNKTIT